MKDVDVSQLIIDGKITEASQTLQHEYHHLAKREHGDAAGKPTDDDKKKAYDDLTAGKLKDTNKAIFDALQKVPDGTKSTLPLVEVDYSKTTDQSDKRRIVGRWGGTTGKENFLVIADGLTTDKHKVFLMDKDQKVYEATVNADANAKETERFTIGKQVADGQTGAAAGANGADTGKTNGTDTQAGAKANGADTGTTGDAQAGNGGTSGGTDTVPNNAVPDAGQAPAGADKPASLDNAGADSANKLISFTGKADKPDTAQITQNDVSYKLNRDKDTGVCTVSIKQGKDASFSKPTNVDNFTISIDDDALQTLTYTDHSGRRTVNIDSTGRFVETVTNKDKSAYTATFDDLTTSQASSIVVKDKGGSGSTYTAGDSGIYTINDDPQNTKYHAKWDSDYSALTLTQLKADNSEDTTKVLQYSPEK